MKRKKPSFNETYHGYRTFSELLEDAQKEGLLELDTDKRSRTYVVTRFGDELRSGPIEPRRIGRAEETAPPPQARVAAAAGGRRGWGGDGTGRRGTAGFRLTTRLAATRRLCGAERSRARSAPLRKASASRLTFSGENSTPWPCSSPSPSSSAPSCCSSSSRWSARWCCRSWAGRRPSGPPAWSSSRRCSWPATPTPTPPPAGSAAGGRRSSISLVLALPLVVLGVTAYLTGAPIQAYKSLAPQGQEMPFFGAIALLAAAVGLPFFVVATSAPLLQRWFADTDHPAARDPYFLYAASNLGSLLALVAYPFLVEPRYRLAEQGWLWSAGYLLLVGLTAGCAWQLRSQTRDTRHETRVDSGGPLSCLASRVSCLVVHPPSLARARLRAKSACC